MASVNVKIVGDRLTNNSYAWIITVTASTFIESLSSSMAVTIIAGSQVCNKSICIRKQHDSLPFII